MGLGPPPCRRIGGPRPTPFRSANHARMRPRTRCKETSSPRQRITRETPLKAPGSNFPIAAPRGFPVLSLPKRGRIPRPAFPQAGRLFLPCPCDRPDRRSGSVDAGFDLSSKSSATSGHPRPDSSNEARLRLATRNPVAAVAALTMSVASGYIFRCVAGGCQRANASRVRFRPSSISSAAR